MEHPFLYLRKT